MSFALRQAQGDMVQFNCICFEIEVCFTQHKPIDSTIVTLSLSKGFIVFYKLFLVIPLQAGIHFVKVSKPHYATLSCLRTFIITPRYRAK